MKRLLLLLFLCLAASAAYPQTADPATRNTVQNCAIRIRYGMQFYLPQNQPYDFTAYADTLYDYLYARPVEMETYLEMFAKITLQSYFYETKDPRIDYQDLRKTLLITQDFEAFYDLFFISCAQAQAEHQEQEGEYEAATRSYALALKALPKTFNNKPTPMAVNYCLALARIYFTHLKQPRQAIPCNRLAVQILSLLGEPAQEAYWENLYGLGNLYSIAGMDLQADSCYTLCQPYMEKLPDAEQNRKADFYESWAGIADNLGRPADAIAHYRQAMLYAETDSAQIQQWINIALVQQQQGRQEDMTASIDKALDLAEQGNTSNRKVLFSIAQLCNHPNAGSQRKRLARLYAHSPGNDSFVGLAQEAYLHWQDGAYDRSRQLIKQAVRTADEAIRQNASTLLQPELNDLVAALSETGEWEQALHYTQLQTEAYQQRYGEDNQATRLQALMQFELEQMCYIAQGDYAALDKLVTQAYQSHWLKENAAADLAKLKATSLMVKGQFLAAADWLERSMPCFENETERFYAQADRVGCLISEYDLRQTNKDDRMPTAGIDSLLDKALQELAVLREAHFPANGQEAYYTLNYQASYAWLKGDREAMRNYVAQAEDVVRKHMTNPELKKTFLDALAFHYILLKDYPKALSLADTSNPTDVLTRYPTLQLLSEAWLGMGNKKKAQAYYTQLTEEAIRKVSSNFIFMTEKERTQYWNLFKQSIYDAGKYAEQFGKPSPFAGLLYDMALFSKNLLLRSSIRIHQAISSSGDPALEDQWDAIAQLRMALANATNQERAHLLREEAEKREKELLQTSALARQLTSHATTRWESVRKALDNHELAIEFIIYYTPDSVGHYAALLLQKAYKHPVLVEIAEKKQFEDTLQDLAVNEHHAAIVWGPLHPYLDDVRTIYFSPTGILHKLPIEYMPYGQAEFISDAFNVFRLSSTGLLIRRQDNSPAPRHLFRSAALYGGLEYDTDVQTLAEQAAQHRSNRGKSRLNYLEGTLQEVNAIDTLLEQANIPTHLYTETQGTEEVFKQLSGKEISLIHIATHGYCTVQRTDENPLPLNRMSTSSQPSVENSMLRSGLYLAGANNVLQDEALPDGLEDGILSAHEISLLDLRRTRLVVLSACVTGDGDITGEGVFGVQRGFKLAGVPSIVMSAWEVSDEATRLLMNHFYQALLQGQSTPKALLEAVRTVKHHPRYQSYRYWAPFILIDGLN